MAKVLINSAAIRKKDLVVVDGDLNVVEDALISVVDLKTGAYALIYDPLDKNTLLQNPFQADETGQFAFWVESGIYKVMAVTQTDTEDLQGKVLIDATSIAANSIDRAVSIADADFSGVDDVNCSSFDGRGGYGVWSFTGLVDENKAGQVVIYDDSDGDFGSIYDQSGNQFKLSSSIKSPLQLGAYNQVVTDTEPNISEILESNRRAFKALENFRGSQQVESGFYILKEPIYIRPLTTFNGASKGNGSSGKLTADFNAENGATVFVPHSSFDMVNFQDDDGETYVVNVEDFPQTTPDANPNLNRFNDGYTGGVKTGNFQINLADYNGVNTRVAKIETLGGLRYYRGYDNINLQDINVLWHGNSRAWKFDSEQSPLRVAQTNIGTGLFSLGDDVERTVECALIRRQQESQYYGMKLLAAPQGTPRNAPCLVVEDCRAVEFYSPSFASVKDNDFVLVKAENRNSNNINFYSPTVENGVGVTVGFRVKGFNGNNVAQCSIKAPREEAPQSTVFLVCDNGCLAGDFDIGQRFATFEAGAESNYIFSKDVYKITDNNPTGRNQVIATGNKNDRVETHKQAVRTWQSDQLSPFFELAAGSNPNTLKKFRIQYDANDSTNLGATLRDLDSGSTWSFLTSGAIQSYSYRAFDIGDSTYKEITINSGDLYVNNSQKTGGATGTFQSQDGKSITVTDGRITGIS